MTDSSQGDTFDEIVVAPNLPWSDRVAYSTRRDGFAYRPRELNCADASTRVAASDLVRELTGEAPLEFGDPALDEHLVRGLHDFDVEYVVDELSARGLLVEPNYVLFANPLHANPLYANPLYANPLYANPVHASPVYASPLYASEFDEGAYRNTGVRPSLARPCAAPTNHTVDLKTSSTVVVLDTGIAAAGKDLLPPLLRSQPHLLNAAAVDDDPPDSNPGDGYLDPVSGHGTFIAGLVQLLAPGQDLRVHRVLTSFGDGDVAGIIARLNGLVTSAPLNAHSIVNLSFGGYADKDMALLARCIRRVRQRTKAVFVASAGNDGVDRLSYPACLPGVVSVGALDQYGPAPYTNYGSWVRACAPGTDLVSAFYRHYNGAMPVPKVPGGSDPDHFESWARWTGTSFAAPIVVAALVRHMALHDCTAQEAVDAVVDGPGLFRVPWLGTVINLVPPVPS
jgi:hypothetical protein